MKICAKSSVWNNDDFESCLAKEAALIFMRREAARIAITKILARNGPLADGIDYILKEEKTDSLLTVHLNCDPGREVREMVDTKRAYGKRTAFNITTSSSPSSPAKSRLSWRWRSPESSQRNTCRAMRL